MRVISSLTGIAAVQVAGDEVAPVTGILQRDLANYIVNRYEFGIYPPDLNEGTMSNLPTLQFQSGKVTHEQVSIPIIQLVIGADGDVIFAQNTDLADDILSDYLECLEADLGFRFKDTVQERIYVSYLVVEFESGLIDRLLDGQVAAVINKATKRDSYQVKRVSFGTDALEWPTDVQSVRKFLPTDFVIERRANEPSSKNRFFCMAPLTTKAHAQALEDIERILLNHSTA